MNKNQNANGCNDAYDLMCNFIGIKIIYQPNFSRSWIIL